VKFGIFSLPTYFPEVDGTLNEFYQHILSLMQDAERLGFSYAWVNEHHFHRYGGMIPAPPVLLAAVAAQTSTIRLGTSVALLPLHHPLEQAESYAMLDQISGGRLDLGIGRGFIPYDYETMGVPYAEGQERLYEALEIMLKAWQHQPFSHKGRNFEIENVSVWPAPLQEPHPPVWGAATRSMDSFRYFGQQGYDLLTVVYLFPQTKLAEFIDGYRDAAASAGYDPATRKISTHYQVYCAENGDEARRVGKEAIVRYSEEIVRARERGHSPPPPIQHESFESVLADGRVCMGNPDDCAAILERARETLGLTNVDCTFYYGGIPYDRARASFELFAREVIPRFQTQPAPARAAS
jgi:alkanesulfonate monooxygenase SsuD/methylene tetrahydromethanopterin reductase-like flavin-dependent oxidoreductase (luciferase family)